MKFFLPIVFAAGLFVSPVFSALSQEEFSQLKGEHFIVYFKSGNEAFSRQALAAAENYYKRIADDLGYQRRSVFWIWENRVKIYIYQSRDKYIIETGQPQWSKGVADYTDKVIASFTQSDEFLNKILPHEIAHLIFRDFVGFKGEVPLWLDEGVAQWEEAQNKDTLKRAASRLFKKGRLFSFSDMMRLDIRRISKDEELSLRSLSTLAENSQLLKFKGEELVGTYYLQAASLVGFLIEGYGGNNFTYFCRKLRDGASIDQALKFAYPAKLATSNDLESRWIKYLSK